ncbi:MAG TPA: FAD-dependent oxidoreductase [Syntrophobacteraceae bacterium]|nr:FAD-dependent oxidoreductase [Syntrophobacteraceae bacterium]
MDEQFDVAVVGAGPAGISAACILAEKGVRTVVLERGEYPGAKNLFGGVLYGHDLAQIVPDYRDRNCPIERNIVESRIWYLSRNGGYSLSYRDRVFELQGKFNAFTTGRARFDRWFAEQAKDRGALILCSTVVTDLLRDSNRRVIGVRTDRPDGDLRARVVLLADGINSPLAKKTGFRPEPKPAEVALSVKEVIGLPEEVIEERFGVESGSGVTVEILGDVTWGMNGVAFLYTNKRSLSVGIGANLLHFSQNRVRPYEVLEAFKQHPMVAPFIKGGKPQEYTAHWLAEGGFDTIPQLCGDGFLITGDSAMLFNALHREGTNLAMASGRMAAETVLEAMDRGDFTRRGLEGYGRRLQESYVLRDMKKYRRFPHLLQEHKEIFTTLPELSSLAAREMLTVNGVPKKEKQRAIWNAVRRKMSPFRLLGLLWDAWRSVR